MRGRSRAAAGLVLLIFLAAAPAPASLPFVRIQAPGSGRLSFLVYGDIQSNYRDGHDGLVAQMLQESAALVFNTGDISADDGKHYERDFYPVVERLARRSPFLPSPGNHDVNWGSPHSRTRFREFFRNAFTYLARLPGNAHLREPDSQKLWYSLKVGPALFVVLDSNFFIHEGRYRKTHAQPVYRGYAREQLLWLRDRLRDSLHDPRIRARFVFFHHSPLVSDETGPWPLLGGGHPGHREMLVNHQNPRHYLVQERFLLDLFRSMRVNAVFTGHEHYYERWREVISDRGRIVHVINWVVTGLGGVKPRGSAEFQPDEIAELLEEDLFRTYLDRISDLNPGWSARLEHAFPTEERPDSRFHNYVRVTVEGEKISFETRDTAGKVRDQGLLAHPDWIGSPVG